MKTRFRNLGIFSAAVISGVVLMHVSQNVEVSETRLRVLQQKIDQEQASLKVLKTEWAYLNNPERLEKLAAQYLNLAPPTPALITADASAMRVEALDENNGLAVQEAVSEDATTPPLRVQPALPETGLLKHVSLESRR